MAKACRATTPAGRISATWRPTSVIPSSAGSRPTGPRAYRASSGSACWLFGDGGTEVRIAPLLDGIRGLSGEKIQWYLAAELGGRIRQNGLRINVVGHLARKPYAVQPRRYQDPL